MHHSLLLFFCFAYVVFVVNAQAPAYLIIREDDGRALITEEASFWNYKAGSCML